MTVLELLQEALSEINAYAQGETPSADDAAFALSKLNRMIDSWNAQRLYVYEVEFVSYVLVPNLSPHTIGPTGTYVVAQRPVKIEAANIILNTVTPNVRVPLNIRNDQWYQNLTVPAVTTTLPTDLYYSADWPNGQLFFWPVPTVAYGVELWTWKLISEYSSLATTVSLPPGYRDALVYSLAEALVPSFARGGGVDLAQLKELAAKSRGIINSVNSQAPSVSTFDAGMPSQDSHKRSNWDYLVGYSRGYR